MPISQSDQLFKLIKSLTKAEKRNFRIYAQRGQEAAGLKFLRLFDLIDKMNSFDEALIFKKIKGIEKVQFANLKRHLYKQILISLRLIHISRNVHIEIREHIDFAQILYDKGLYLQTLKILNRAYKLASKVNNELLMLEIVEFEKIVESRHITRSGPERADELTKSSASISTTLNSEIQLSNLRIQLHSSYIRNGHIKNQQESNELEQFLKENLPKLNLKALSFREKLFYYQSMVWYYFILLDFENCYQYALKWAKNLEADGTMIQRDPANYLRAYHYLLTAAYNIQDKKNFIKHLAEIESFRKNNYSKFNNSSQILSFVYVHHARLNLHFLLGTFSEGVKIIPRTLRRINRYKEKLDAHRILVFYFKIAWMHLNNGNAGKAIDYLNKILNAEEKSKLRADLQVYTQLMFLMAHYDAENELLIAYLIKSVRKKISKLAQQDKLVEINIAYFKKIIKLPNPARKPIFLEFQKELIALKNDPFAKRAFIYLDMLSWIESKCLTKNGGRHSASSSL